MSRQPAGSGSTGSASSPFPTRWIRAASSQLALARRLGARSASHTDATVLLSLGALTWEKDPIAHVEIGARVLSQVPGSMHVIAGDGPLRSEVESAVIAKGLADRVLVLGSREDLADILAASDVMLLASATEGMPGAVIEAGMAGLPVAGYSVAGVPEVVLDGETGFLSSPGDLDALADSAVRLLLSEEERKRMGERASHRCREHFDIAAVAPAYLALYRELAS